MNPLVAIFGDPVWQILTVILVLALPVGIMAVRTRDMHASADQKHRETRRVLLLCLIVFVLLSGSELVFHARQASPPQQYARSLQQTHPESETFAAWRKFTRCTIPDQGGDPSTLSVLTLTFANGSTDRFGRSGDVDYRFSMADEDARWKIAGVCDIMAEGCFPVSWG